MSATDNRVAILIPGTLGTKLYDAEGRVWPGNLLDLIFKFSSSKFQRLLAIPLDTGDIIRKILFVKFYEYLVDDLADCGYRETDSPPTLYVCKYDWRLPLQTTTDKLAILVDQARADHGAGVDISIVSHSQGGLMGRYYLESGLYDGNPGFASVRQLILMGVPNEGLPKMVLLARGEEDNSFLDAQQVQVMLNTDGLAFAYLMLPSTSAQKMWHNTGPLPLESYNMFQSAKARAIGLYSDDNLEAATEFRRTLSAGTMPANVRYFSFVGSDLKTLNGGVVDTTDITVQPLPIDWIRRPDGGDRMVPLWSAWLAGQQGLVVGGAHDKIFRDRALRSYLAILLGCPPQEALARFFAPVDVRVDEFVYAPGAPMEARLSFAEPQSELPGELRLLRAEIDGDGELRGFEEEDLPPFEFEGTPVTHLRFQVPAPPKPGIYRLEFRHVSGERYSDDFFVQDKSSEHD